MYRKSVVETDTKAISSLSLEKIKDELILLPDQLAFNFSQLAQ
jgi:hypothetical protein